MKTISKIAAITIAIFFILSMTASITLIPNANARDIQGTIPSYAFLEAVPSQVAAGQNVFLVMWLDKPPPTALFTLGDRWTNMMLTITLPDGSKLTEGPFESDDAGGHTYVYTPTALGNYSAVFTFPGETLTGSQGNPGNPYITPQVGDVFGPATSAVVNFTVGTTPASYISQNPLPTSYWQTPVEAFNNNWNVIDGNWLGMGSVEFANTGDYAFTGNFNPYTTAPLTGHILWTRPEVPGAPGGQMGGEFGNSEASNYYSGFQYQPKFAPIVINGVLYYDACPTYTDAGAYQGWVAVNLFTGATIWTKNYQNYFAPGSYDLLLCGQVYQYVTMNTYGGQTFLWATRTTDGINYLDLFDAATGNYILSVNGSQASGSFGAANVEGSDGSLLQYYISTNYVTGQQTFNEWNSSLCLNPTDSQFWGPQVNAVIPYSQGIEWSTNLTESYQGTAFPAGVSWIFDGVAHGCIDTQNNIAIMSAGAGDYSLYEWNTGWIMEAAYNLNNGQQIWIKNQTETPYATTMIQPGASNGTYVEWTKETMTFTGYSTLTGDKVWGPTTPDVNQLAYYDQTSTVMAYGCLYAWTFGGYVYCYNVTNGNLIWTWNDGSAGENTPYGVNPLWIIGDYEASVADHVIYVETGHDYGPPLFNGAQLYAINATDGKEIWSILNFDSGSCPAVVDGDLLTFNAYDNQIYCYGMGPTKTTVTAPDVGVTTATPITITGTVTDISAGSQQSVIAANFPNGLPCVSDASMSQFMEAVYEQSPMPTNLTGVPVTIAVTDKNGNCYVIGTTTTNPTTGFYSLNWTPDIPGNYTVTATFANTNSYYGSSAETAFYASAPGATTAPTASPPSGLASTSTVELGIAAVIIVIVIIGVAILAVLMRKRP